MYYKPDWDVVKKRLLAWWNHEIVDRCCIAIHAPRRTSTLPPFPDLQYGPWTGGMENISDDDHAAIERWWKDPELNYRRAITWFENNYFGGEALPITYINWGAMSMAAMLGSPAEFNKTSVWYPAVIEDWDTWKWHFNPETDTTWQTILAIMRYFIENAEGNYLVGSPELGNGADVLSLLRGMDKLAMDLYMYPDAVKHGVDFISDIWVELMEQVHLMTESVNDNGNVVAWMGLWAPGRTDQLACDFSSVISPKMFKEFFVPEIKKMGDWCSNGVYHLDGPECMKNMLDALLEIEQISAIQFTPGIGIGTPPTFSEHYVPRYQQILESGRNLYLLVTPQEVEKILGVLPPEGLYMRTYVDTEDDANELIKKVTKWSARGNQFPRP